MIYPDQHMGFSALAFACVVWLGFMVYVIRGAMRDAKASDAIEDEATTEAAHEMLCESSGRPFLSCPGCGLFVHREDSAAHARLCVTLREKVTEAHPHSTEAPHDAR